MILVYLVGLFGVGAAIAIAILAVWRRAPRRPRPLVCRCETCGKFAELRLVPFRDSCRWVCVGCFYSLTDDGAGP